MAQITLRGCCKFCEFASNFKYLGKYSTCKKTKLTCYHPDNKGDLKNISATDMTHENGFCEHFKWGNIKKYSVILRTFDNMQKEE